MSRRSRRRSLLAGLEWFFLLLGLVALDCYVWINAGTMLSQSYSDWAFDQTLRGQKPSVPGFVSAEFSWLFSKHEISPAMPEPVPIPEKPSVAPRLVPPKPDSVIGRLQIPRLNLKVMVREGAGEFTLSRAVGHISGTALPGRIGNVALAGHRDTFFRPLRNIKKNDVIDVQTADGTYQYAVDSTRIVSPRDVEVLKASGGQTLTLVTCYPFYYVGSAPKRFIVHATRLNSNISPLQPGS